MNTLNGIFAAVVTPFDKDGSLDLTALRNNFTAWNSAGLSGYLVLGSTGETVHLDDSEKFAVLGAARSSIPENKPMIVGTGLHSTQATIAFTRHAANLGATHALIVTPHYFKKEMTQAALKAFYEETAEASPIPVLLYSVPQFTGVQLASETVAALSEHPNIVGIKDSSGDMRAFINTISLVDDDFAVLTGSAPLLFSALMSCAQGAILAVANFAPKLCIEIRNLSNLPERESLQKASEAQERLLNVSEKIASRYGIGGIKYAMDCLDYKGGFVRKPLMMPDAQAQQAIRACIEEYL